MVDLCDLFVYSHPWSWFARGIASAFDDTLLYFSTYVLALRCILASRT